MNETGKKRKKQTYCDKFSFLSTHACFRLDSAVFIDVTSIYVHSLLCIVLTN